MIEEMSCATRSGRTALSPIFRRITFGIVLLALFGSVSPASAQATTTAEITFVDPASQSLAPKSGGTFEFEVALKNAGKQSGTPVFKLLGDGCVRAEPAAGSTFKSLEPGEIAIEKLRISDAKLPAPCHLELQTREEKSANRSLKQLKLAQHHLTEFFIWALVACLVISAIAMIVAAKKALKFEKDLRVGAPAWDFTKSWTSTLTFAGGILSIALALSALPELTRHGSKAGYATVALLLSLAVLVAPLLFTLFTSGSIKEEMPDKPAVKHDGPVLHFFLSCLVMLAAGLAQIVVLFLLLDEVFGSKDDWFLVPGAAILGLGFALCWYAVKSMVLTIELQLWKKLPLTPKSIAPTGQPGPSPRDWPLL